ncbi:SDR family oxidoreductase [Bradyrhizobium sp. AUGA SZCCT0240]|uniref:SDR family oxidoreductase n=1 Tax=unclassified Bradyrhizobium TaxID=2631580 RepID=UPI001BAD469C|nr:MULTISPECIES: SDR family oxidoreductase [unclassified Bradyrhizobium]MBR1194691.1 SDR family oxidoreductase [Bradyrhizobium sp. AUGA SZCCT0158]MBR1239293.1 SDR family oxidoreductase [Bradyrhizobium sp. AUGA SZCCT0274]MBR1254276.1 SDR family oxidoreductase [Bradyrhizobium sp. AUGA SZCCT0240]
MSESNVAIVTGASGGIGRAIAEAMLAAGYRIISLDRRLPDWTHAKLEPVLVDLFDPKATADAARDVTARHDVSHIVHNAGIIRPNLIEQVTVDDIAALSQLHLGAALTLVQAALPGMKQRHFGRIVLIASRAALGAATRTAYSATKSGMFGMARTWALETAAHGITVNVVAPGPVETDMFHEVIPQGSPKVDQLARSIPVGRIGRPNDVARAVMFFASRDADFITGQSLYVCGGASIGSIAL